LFSFFLASGPISLRTWLSFFLIHCFALLIRVRDEQVPPVQILTLSGASADGSRCAGWA
jgi:hypothetical protein